MLVERIVEVRIRKGLGPAIVTRNFTVAFDDLPEDTDDYTIRKMAVSDVEHRLMNTEDYQHYGRNWEIVEVHNC